jgi:FtsP/CotA-like multicopper oxidase with cupredoxin domain
VQSDGNDVEPVSVDEFRIGIAETYDVIVEPKDDTAYTIFAQAQDRTGYARATLAPRMGMTAEVPPMDPRPVRTMQDMGMSMAGLKMSGMKGMDMSDMKGMDMSGMRGMDMSGMKGMDMANMVMGDPTGTTPFPQPGPHTMPLSKTSYKETKFEPSDPVQLHIGPQEVEVSKHVMSRYNDPGDGLNGNGRRVLTYADLRSRYRGIDGRPPSRDRVASDRQHGALHLGIQRQKVLGR